MTQINEVALLGPGRIEFTQVCAALDDFGCRGNMKIEGAVPPGGRLFESHASNLKFLRALFSVNA